MDLVINIFVGLSEEENPTPVEKVIKPTRLDPFEELRTTAGPITVDYKGRYQNSRSIAFMDFSRGDRRWLNHLLIDLQRIGIGSAADNKIMQGIATARNGFHQKQTWLEFIDGMVKDKVHAGHDFSTGQMKHLPALIAELGHGNKLSGCGTLQFRDTITDTLL